MQVFMAPRHQIEEKYEKENCKKRAPALGNIRKVLGRNKDINVSKMHFFLGYKGLECVDQQERNRIWMYYQLKSNINVYII